MSKHKGTLDELQDKLVKLGIMPKENATNPVGGDLCTTWRHNGLIVNWWPRTGTVQFQGMSDRAAEAKGLFERGPKSEGLLWNQGPPSKEQIEQLSQFTIDDDDFEHRTQVLICRNGFMDEGLTYDTVTVRRDRNGRVEYICRDGYSVCTTAEILRWLIPC
jgi:hypothetical protein